MTPELIAVLIPIIGVLIPVVAIVGGISVAIASIRAKAKTRQLEIQERIAMIEKGLVPPPEVDPRGFDRAMEGDDRGRAWSGAGSGGRHRRAGITLMGVGFGLMVLISLAGESLREGVGVGGFLVVLGLAFFINSLFELRQQQPPASAGPGPDELPHAPPPPAGS